MNIIVEDLAPCKKKLKIEVPYEEMKEEVNRIKQSVQAKASIPGFRAGKAPWTLIQQYYGHEIYNEVVNQVVSSTYVKALEEKELNPIKQPAVDKVDYKEEQGLSYEVEVEYLPKFELPEYANIEVKKKPVNITEGDVLKELSYLQERKAQFEPVEGRAVNMGDYAIISYQFLQKKEVLDEAKDVWIEMSENFFIPKFCQNLVGMKKDEEKEVKSVVPEGYPKTELRGKKVIIKVKLNEIKKKTLPEMNDEFAQELGSYKDLNELKSKIKQELTVYAEQMVRKEMVRQLEDYLLSKTSVEVPASVTDNYAQALYDDTIANLKRSGVDSEKYIKEKDAELKETTRKEAVDQVKLVYILNEIAQQEEIEVTEEEIKSHMKELAERNNKSVAEIEQYMEKENHKTNLTHNLRREKIVSFLLDKAKLTESPEVDQNAKDKK